MKADYEKLAYAPPLTRTTTISDDPKLEKWYQTPFLPNSGPRGGLVVSFCGS